MESWICYCGKGTTVTHWQVGSDGLMFHVSERMMTIDDVPADTVVELTAELDRLFKAAGCNPACHACKQGSKQKQIKIGDHFQLLSYNGIDEMVCATCDRTTLKKRDDKKRASEARLEKEHAAYKERHPGYSRPSATAAELPGRV